MTPALILLVGLLALIACGILVFRERRREAQRRRQLDMRLAQLRFEVAPEAVEAPAATGGLNLILRTPRWIRLQLDRADIELTQSQILLPVLALAAVDLLLLRFLNPLAPIAVTLLAIGAALFALRSLAKRRIERFIDAMPALFDLVKHLLLAGNSLQQGLIKAIDSSGAPVQRYLRPVARRMQNGAPVADSILVLADRLDVPELFIFGTGVQTNARYGGKMSTMLGNLAQIVRDGARVRRELRSATAETRMSAIILSLMPIVAGVVIAVFNPTYMRFFIDTSQGQHMAMAAVGMQCAGMLVMRRILRLEF